MLIYIGENGCKSFFQKNFPNVLLYNVIAITNLLKYVYVFRLNHFISDAKYRNYRHRDNFEHRDASKEPRCNLALRVSAVRQISAVIVRFFAGSYVLTVVNDRVLHKRPLIRRYKCSCKYKSKRVLLWVRAADRDREKPRAPTKFRSTNLSFKWNLQKNEDTGETWRTRFPSHVTNIPILNKCPDTIQSSTIILLATSCASKY